MSPLNTPKMYKRPSPFRHGCCGFNPPSDYSMMMLLASREPTSVPKKQGPAPLKGHLYSTQNEWLLRRSELSTEKRDEFYQQYQRDGDTNKYLKEMHMLPYPEPDILIPEAEVKKERPIFWACATLVLKVEGDGVKVHIDGKLGDIYAKYLNKAKKPPLRPYAEALLSAGRTPEQVNKVIDGYVWWKKNKAEMQKEFDKLFPAEKKKGTVVKKKEFKAVVKRIV